MKNKALKYITIVLIGILSFSCQDLERPEFSNFLYDGPIITLTSPSPSGTTVVRSTEPIAPITIQFQVEDDLGIANITVNLDGQEIANINEFSNDRLVNIDDLTQEVSTGSHTLTIVATDIHDVEITLTTPFEKIETPPYTPVFDGEQLYMAFNGDFSDGISDADATVVGNPSFTENAFLGSNSYAGATDSYLTFPATSLQNESFSATMWYKLNADPDRASVLVMGPVDDANPDAMNNRTKGFRFFRENAGGKQRFKLNVGNGTGDVWIDGGAAADVDPAVDEWVHLAFTISPTKAVVYINGNVAKEGDISGVNFEGCDLLSIMSGAPRFTGWGHKSDNSYLDELRIFNKSLTQSEITNMVATSNQTFKMTFENSFTDIISETDATVVGTPSLSTDAKFGSNAYAGASDSYLTFPSEGLTGESFSATMWYKLNADPDRAGVLVMGPVDEANPDAMNNRTKGFRFFRENAGGKQRFKLNVGNGTSDAWIDGGTAADVDPAVDEWVHLAFTISPTKAIVYINGEPVKEGDINGVSFEGCDILSIMSGAPRFSGWGHKSDSSLLDNLQLYNKALSKDEVQATM